MHISPSSKKYIGITSRDVKKRWANGYGYMGHDYFYKAIQKHGWENIKHEILFENLTESEAKQKEIELIAFYKSYDREFGYNQTLGGDGRKGAMSEKQKKILSIVNRGKNAQISDDVIVKIKTDLLNRVDRKEIEKKYNVCEYVLQSIALSKNYRHIMPEFKELYNKVKEENKQKRLEFEKQVVELAEKGYSFREINKILEKATNCVINNILKKYSIKTKIAKSNKKSKEIRKIVSEAYKNGTPRKVLMEKYNLSSQNFINYTQGIYTELKKAENEKLKQEMCELRKQGWQVKDIAKKYGCHREKVTKLTKDFAIELKMIDVRKVYELKDKGFTNREIARTVKRDIDFVENWLNKRSIEC